MIFAWYQVSSYCTNTHQYIFADDTLFFARASRAEATNLLNLLHSYTATTSQSINYHKSHILFSKRTSVHWLLCVRYLPLVNIWVYQCYLDVRIRKLWLLWKIALRLKHSPRSKNYYHILVKLLWFTQFWLLSLIIRCLFLCILSSSLPNSIACYSGSGGVVMQTHLNLRGLVGGIHMSRSFTEVWDLKICIFLILIVWQSNIGG